MSTMSHENAQLLRAAYDGFARGDLEPLLDSLADDIAWEDSTLGPLAGNYVGKEQVLGLFGRMMEVYGGTSQLEVVDILANDDRGVVLTREQGTTSGEHLKWTGVHLWEFRGGQCARFTAYNNGEYQRFWSERAQRSEG
jgi:ketosteroid isomerase-like protein